MRFKSLAGGLTGLALLSALLPQAARASSADLVFVLNSGEANIQILDGRSREEIRRIPVLREVHHLTLTPDRSQILVGDSGGNEMLFLDPATGEVVGVINMVFVKGLKESAISTPSGITYAIPVRHVQELLSR